MLFSLLHSWTDDFGRQFRVLLQNGDQGGRLPFPDQYIVFQQASFTRLHEPTWIDVLVFPYANSGNNDTIFLISLLTSLNFTFPPVTA